MKKPLVGVIMGSDSDFPIMKGAIKILKDFQIDVEVSIISAHRTPEKAINYAKEAEKNGIDIIIAAQVHQGDV
ncbi:MAG TPA: AIR carboxylase family protein, partial [Thermoanaerobacterales bacterium]|nr:AIR carboxylase family protein [Thermoanaerobacterales bacterium]